MATVKQIVDYFETIAPSEMSIENDNVGLLVGLHNTEVSKLLVALDITDEVIDEAVTLGAQLIISHHPLFFDLNAVGDETIIGRKIIKLVQNGISALCLHTNLDQAPGGVNDTLAQTLGICPEGYLSETQISKIGASFGMGRYGYLDKPLAFDAFLPFVKNALNTNGLRYHDAGRAVHKLAVCGGSGGEYVQTAALLGCDTLVTADIKYYEFLNAKALGLNLIDAGHFCTENVVVPVIEALAKKEFPTINTVVSKNLQPTVQFF